MPDPIEFADLLDEEPSAERQRLDIQTEQPPRLRVTAAGITMEMDLHQMLTAVDPQGSWLGYDPDADEDRYEPASLVDHIVRATALELVKTTRHEVKKAVLATVQDAVQEEVVGIVRETLSGEVQPTTEWGTPSGPAMSLTQMVVQAAEDMAKPAQEYGRRTQSPLQKMVTEAVGAAFKKELAEVVEAQRQAVKAAVQDQAAQVLRETIERASRGL